MANTTKKVGRPKKSETKAELSTESKTTDENALLVQELLKQVQELKDEVAKQKEEKEKTTNENSELQQLVSVLKEQAVEKSKEVKLPNTVKVVSLMDNIYNLVDRTGTVYEFPKFGHSHLIRVSDLETIISDARFRSQAEKGYFYICNADVVEYLGLSDYYENINDEKSMKLIRELESEDSVDLFCGLAKGMQNSVATKIAEDIASGRKFDLNKIDAIYRKTNIDIQKMADDFVEIRKKGEAKLERNNK